MAVKSVIKLGNKRLATPSLPSYNMNTTILDGILFPQRIKDMKFFGFEDELKNIIWPQAKT